MRNIRWILELIFFNIRSVSWIRGADSHIITVDQETFISDSRFSSLIKARENLWTLKVRAFSPPQLEETALSGYFQIKYVTARDAGKYECQVSTVPKMSRKVELVVVVPKVGSLSPFYLGIIPHMSSRSEYSVVPTSTSGSSAPSTWSASSVPPS